MPCNVLTRLGSTFVLGGGFAPSFRQQLGSVKHRRQPWARVVKCYTASQEGGHGPGTLTLPSLSEEASQRVVKARLAEALEAPLQQLPHPNLADCSPMTGMEEDADIARVLFSKDVIARRITELGQNISFDFAGKQVSLIGVATGGFMFLADLVREVSVPITIDLMRAQSYGSGTTSSGKVDITTDLKLDVRDKHVILVEDIIDTGHTFVKLLQHLRSKGAASVSFCVLLNKSARREARIEMGEGGRQYIGFECPDEFVVGYGLDFDERYRSLPYVGILKREVFSSSH